MKPMKGTYFIKPLEFKLNVDGESWIQGDTITGVLEINNHSVEAIDSSKLGCYLCFCNSKKLKVKDKSAIQVIQTVQLIKDENVINFQYKLPSDCAITDNINNYYIICGDINAPFTNAGQLELMITPTHQILNFVEVFEQFFRFKFKKFKNKKEYIEVLVTPPDSKEWARIQKMSLKMRMSGNNLDVLFSIDTKSLSFDNTLAKTKDEKREIKRVLTKKEYELYGSTNQEGIKKVIAEVLEQIKLKPII
jgi:hypothetical protein